MSPHLATREAEVDVKSTRHIQLLAAVSLALTILPAIEAEPRCPGNTASVTPRLVQHALIVIPVKINQSGPFEFMVDTGSQLNVIDPSLAAQLGLTSQGTVGLLRFPDTLTRLHALTKADNLGLGLVVVGLLPQTGSLRDGLKPLRTEQQFAGGHDFMMARRRWTVGHDDRSSPRGPGS